MASSAVTVVIPTHNRLELLRQTLRSVAAQHPSVRVVVVDDGSSDGTVEALAMSPEIAVLANATGGWGSGRARNAGLADVTTRYVAFVDSDDLLTRGALAAMSGALDGAPTAPFAFGRALAATHGPNGWSGQGLMSPLPSECTTLGASIFASNFVPSSGAMVRTDAIRAVGGYDTGLDYSEDHDLWLRLIGLGDPVHVPRLVLVHRRHGGNRHAPERARDDDDIITARALASPRLAALAPERLGVQLCEEGLDALRAGRPQDVGAALQRRLLGGPHRPTILRAAARHYRRRITARRTGERLWADNPEFRDWLSTYE